MSLNLLLDENISQIIAAQAKSHRPQMVIESIHHWREGAFEGHTDKTVLQTAQAENLTLVTYDQKTIPPLLAELYAEGGSHSGVIFVDDKTIPSNDFGALTRALIFLWDRFGQENWQDRIRFLEKPIR